MFRSFFRMQMLNPVRMRGVITHLPHFVRLFYRLMTDPRVPLMVRLVPLIGVLALITPPALELDFIPIIGELDWLLVGFLTLKLFVWLCPPEVVREHVSRIALGA